MNIYTITERIAEINLLSISSKDNYHNHLSHCHWTKNQPRFGLDLENRVPDRAWWVLDEILFNPSSVNGGIFLSKVVSKLQQLEPFKVE